MTPVLALYAAFGLSIGQLAKADPAMRPSYSYPMSGAKVLEVAQEFSPRDPVITYHAPSLRPYVDNSKKYKPGSDFGAREYSKEGLHGASLVGAEFVPSEGYKPLLFIYHMWIKEPREGVAQPLSCETAHNWKVFAKQYQKFTENKLGSLEDWLRRNTASQGPDFEKSVSELEWMLRRGGSQQGIWWTKDQIYWWQKAKLNWEFMIQLGDLLQFDKDGKGFELSKNRIKEIQKKLLPILEAAKLNKSFGSRLEGPEGSQEIRTLRKLTDENCESMYETRIAQVINKIQKKQKAEFTDAPFAKLPNHLLSDLGLLAFLKGTQRGLQPDTFKVNTQNYEILVFKPHGRAVVSAKIAPPQRIMVQPPSLGYARQRIALDEKIRGPHKINGEQVESQLSQSTKVPLKHPGDPLSAMPAGSPNSQLERGGRVLLQEEVTHSVDN